MPYPVSVCVHTEGEAAKHWEDLQLAEEGNQKIIPLSLILCRTEILTVPERKCIKWRTNWNDSIFPWTTWDHIFFKDIIILSIKIILSFMWFISFGKAIRLVYTSDTISINVMMIVNIIKSHRTDSPHCMRISCSVFSLVYEYELELVGFYEFLIGTVMLPLSSCLMLGQH